MLTMISGCIKTIQSSLAKDDPTGAFYKLEPEPFRGITGDAEDWS